MNQDPTVLRVGVGEREVNMPVDKRNPAVIVDMDGTLVDVSSIRHYVREALLPDGSYTKKNFDDFHKASILCPAIWSTVDQVQEHWTRRQDVLIVTARGAQYEKTTRDWLFKYGIGYNKLFMRPIGDQRPDVEVKRDILMEILKTWNPVRAYDDNPSVIALWDEYKIPTTVVPGWID